MDGSVDFYRNWQNYKLGFGSLHSEFWLGLDKLATLINNGLSYELRIDIESHINVWKFAKYRTFIVAGEDKNYRLTVANYTGTAGKQNILS